MNSHEKFDFVSKTLLAHCKS